MILELIFVVGKVLLVFVLGMMVGYSLKEGDEADDDGFRMGMIEVWKDHKLEAEMFFGTGHDWWEQLQIEAKEDI
jgi:hypothetical protein